MRQPDWLLGCVVYTSPFAGPGVAAVADCTVEGQVSSLLDALRELARFAADAMGVPEVVGITSYSIEHMRRLGYTVAKAFLAKGEARIVTYKEELVNASVVVPGLQVRPLRVGMPLAPPVPGSPLRKPLSQPLVPRLIAYRVEESVPSHPGEITLSEGSIGVTIGLDELRDRAVPRRLALHCVTGWTAVKTWNVVSIAELLAEHGMKPARWAIAQSSGGYSASIPGEALNDTLIAVGMEGQPLPPEHGGPARLIAPSLYGWKHVKWVSSIHLVDGYVDSYWEARGYHENGRVGLEERFKLRNPRLAPLTRYGKP